MCPVHILVFFLFTQLAYFLIFKDDLNKKNQAHCHYLIGLARMGMGERAAAAEAFTKAIELEPTHQNAIRYREMCR